MAQPTMLRHQPQTNCRIGHSASRPCGAHGTSLRCSSSLHSVREFHVQRGFGDQEQVKPQLHPKSYIRLPLHQPDQHVLLGLQLLQHRQLNRKRKCLVQCQAEAEPDYRTRSKQDVRVVVAGSTGYIGKYVTKELIKRGYDVVALAREKSGVGGKQSKEQVQQV